MLGTGTVNLVNLTITKNFATAVDGGGGIYHFGGTLSLVNTLVSGNDTLDGSGSEIVKTASAIAGSQYNNLLGSRGSTNTQAFIGFTPSPSDITATFGGTKPTGINKILEPLNDNGGSTKTHALVQNSPAINAAIFSYGFPFPSEGCYVPPFPGLYDGYYRDDQRGIIRPQDGKCDIGAYEYVSTQFFVVPVPGGKTVIFGL